MVDLAAGYTAAQVRAAERPLLEAGTPLMARAASGLARACLPLLRDRPYSVLVLAGSGNNGGDALLAAAALGRRGVRVTIAPLGRRIHAGGLAAVRAAGGRVLPPDTAAGVVAVVAASSGLVLDGLLGTGATGPLRPPARQVVARLAAHRAAPVVAVDLPSGVDPDTGLVRGPVLRAALTVTFGAGKAGLLHGEGRAVAGRVHLVDIGLGPTLAAVLSA